MVEGLDRFGKHFSNHKHQYILIGGAACTLAMDEAGREFRVTKDLDIVLYVEALDAEFAESFWRFVRAGQYKIHERSSGEKRFYRFHRPAADGYPFMLELFSRTPDAITLKDQSRLTPIPIDASVSSLSAILLEEAYYRFIQSGRRFVNDVPILRAEHLIPLKARAWLDLSRRKANGDQVDSRSIKKHKNDVFRLYAILDPEFSAEIPPKIKKDLAEFLDQMESDNVALESLGLAGENLSGILAELRRIYGAE